MVINPKNYQNLFCWGMETALDLLYGATVTLGKQISEMELYQHLCDATPKNVERRQISRTVYELKRGGYIAIESDSVQLTNKARMKIVDKIAAGTPQTTQYFLVSFDIPEVLSTGRRQFRQAIKKMGFRQIQKSLWVANRQLGDLVEVAALEYGVDEYVAYFIANHSNIDHHIKNIMAKD